MGDFSRHVRLVYLFALFQVLGGPAVLCGVIGLVRLASDRQLTLAEHAERAMQRIEQRERGLAEKPKVRQRPVQQEERQPVAPAPVPQTDETKLKFAGIVEEFAPAAIAAPEGRKGQLTGYAGRVVWRPGQPLLKPPRLG